MALAWIIPKTGPKRCLAIAPKLGSKWRDTHRGVHGNTLRDNPKQTLRSASRNAPSNKDYVHEHLEREMEPYFHAADTNRVMKILKSSGFSGKQARALKSGLGRLLHATAASSAQRYLSEKTFQEFQELEETLVAELSTRLKKANHALDPLKIEKHEAEGKILTLRNSLKNLLSKNKSRLDIEFSTERRRVRDELWSLASRIHQNISSMSGDASRSLASIESITMELWRTFFSLTCAGGALYLSYLRFTS